MPGDVPIRHAATLVLLRDVDPGLEVLMVRRSRELVFEGGSWVFPGGRLDQADWEGADGDEETAARRAAVRETREEAGLVVGPSGLVPLSHWTTPPGPPRRFATWFFLARAGDDLVEVDGEEIREHRWMTPATALAGLRDGEVQLPPPTFVTLTWLADHPDAAQALAAAGDRDPERFEPRIVRAGDGAVALYAGDAGFDAGEPDAVGARHRLWITGDGYRYERDGDLLG